MHAEHHQKHDHDPKKHPNGPALFVDNEPYQWDGDTITGEQIRELAGAPQDVEIFHKIPGSPDEEVKDATVVNLTLQRGPDHFSTQSVGSQAG